MLSAPNNLTLVSQTTAQAVLGWSAPSTGAAATYNIYRDGIQIATGIAALTYTDSTVVANRRYRYTMTGIVNGAETPYSNAVNADIEPSSTLTFESVFQEMPGEGGYPDILWRWQ